MASCYLLYLLVPTMPAAASSRADADRSGNKISAAAAAATIHALGDIVLDFGVDSMPACSAFLRAASPVFNRMLVSGMPEAEQGAIKVGSGQEGGICNFCSLITLSWCLE